MSEQSPNQRSIDFFVELTKARLDEMAADAKLLESRLDTFDASLRAQAGQTVTLFNDWIADGQAKIREVQAKGASVADAQRFIETAWAKFQTEADRWVEVTKNQQAAFEARARAQAEAWQNLVNTYVQRMSEVHAQNRALVEAQVEQLKADAQKAQAELKAKVDDLGRAGQASWAAMNQALDESRNAFAKAAEITAKTFNEAAKG
jgi:hypothetical protein